METFRRTIGSRIWHLALAWRMEADRVLKPFGLTHAQYSVLASLHHLSSSTEPTQAELADYAGLQPIYLSKLIRSLEALNFVRRRPDDRDTRAMRLSLTEEGASVIVPARRAIQALDAELVSPLGGPEAANTIGLGQMLDELLQRGKGQQ